MSVSAAPSEEPRFALARLIAGQVCLHACMAGMRLASPLLALREGHSPLAVGFLLALFGTAGAVVGVSVVFWSVGVAVGAGARWGWLLRPPQAAGSPGSAVK